MNRTITTFERGAKSCVVSSVRSLPTITLALTGLPLAGNLLLPSPPISTG